MYSWLCVGLWRRVVLLGIARQKKIAVRSLRHFAEVNWYLFGPQGCEVCGFPCAPFDARASGLVSAPRRASWVLQLCRLLLFEDEAFLRPWLMQAI